MTDKIIKLLYDLVRSAERYEAYWQALPVAERHRIEEERRREAAEKAAMLRTDAALGIQRFYAAEKAVDPDAEFRLEVCEALQAEGKAPHVAANLTNTPAKLLAEGKRLQLI